MSELKAFSIDDLDLVQLTQENTEMEVDVNFPFSPEFPATTGLELEGGHNVVYFEIDPDKKLGTHTDSPEELIICLQGQNIEAYAGDATGEIGAGDLAVIPPMAPHGFHNGGDERAKFLGIFSDSTNVSEFEEELQPMGERTVKG